MLPEERARLIDYLEKETTEFKSSWGFLISCDDGESILSDLRRLDLLEKALRPLANMKFYKDDCPETKRMIARKYRDEAKQALGDA